MSACVIGSKPHEADHGHLCGHHFEHLAAMLRDVEDEAALLTTIPSMQARQGNRGATLASHRSPAILTAVVANDPRHGAPPKTVDRYDPWAFDDTASVLNTLHSWARIVREDRQLSAPDTITVSGERDLWTRNLDWIAEQPWIDEAYGEIKALLGQLRGTNGTRPDRAYSPCPVIVNAGPCRGEVWIHDELQLVWRRHPDRCTRDWEHAPGAATCDTCAATWTTPADKARLQRMIDDAATELARPHTDDGRPMRTAAELATDLGLHVTAIRMRLSRAGIKAGRAGYYDPAVLGEREKETA